MNRWFGTEECKCDATVWYVCPEASIMFGLFEVLQHAKV